MILFCDEYSGSLDHYLTLRELEPERADEVTTCDSLAERLRDQPNVAVESIVEAFGKVAMVERRDAATILTCTQWSLLDKMALCNLQGLYFPPFVEVEKA